MILIAFIKQPEAKKFKRQRSTASNENAFSALDI